MAVPYWGLWLVGRITRRWQRTFEKFVKIFSEVQTAGGPLVFTELQPLPFDPAKSFALGTESAWNVRVHLYADRKGSLQSELTLINETVQGEF